MLYEIDFFPVGDAKSAGDAISLRYSSNNGKSWSIGVVDAGNRDSGETICNHIRKYYGSETIDFIVCTHPDPEHVSGVPVLLEEMTVNKILMHCPWDYVDRIAESAAEGCFTKDGLKVEIKNAYPLSYSIYQLAKAKGIPIHHAFSDNNDHGIPFLLVVGPSEDFYLRQLLGFKQLKQTKDSPNVAQLTCKSSSDYWADEELVEPCTEAISKEDNTSIILLFNFTGEEHLLTADAGVPALEEAANKMEELGISLQNFAFIQVPHHGDKDCIGPEILNRLVGHPKPKGIEPSFTALISAPEDNEACRLDPCVVNAFIRRGARVAVTQGTTKSLYSDGMPDRRGWSNAACLTSHDIIEETENLLGRYAI